jgi:hypothetical protein
MPHDNVKQIEKMQLVLPAQTSLLEIKKKLDEISGKNFLLYLRNSFMPSLSSKVGDLAQCYGRYEER